MSTTDAAAITELLQNNYSSRKTRIAIPATPPELILDRINGHDLVRIEGRSRTCRVCSKNGIKTDRGFKRQSSYECEQCKVALCRRPCFIDFHVPADE